MELLRIFPASPEPLPEVQDRLGFAWLIGADVQDFVIDQLAIKNPSQPLPHDSPLHTSNGWYFAAELNETDKHGLGPQAAEAIVWLIIGDNSSWNFTVTRTKDAAEICAASYIEEEFSQSPHFPAHHVRTVRALLRSGPARVNSG